MADKRLSAALATLLMAGAALGAQEPAAAMDAAAGAPAPQQAAEAKPYYFTLGDDGNPVFTQVIRWEGDPDALEYEVIVLDSSGATFLDERSSEAAIELHLAPGAYKYRIVTYNLLGKAEAETDWIGITIIKAEQPALSGASPAAIYMDSLDGRVTIEGEKLLPDGIASLVPANGRPASAGTVVTRKGEEEIVVVFPDKAYEPGDYSLSFVNPGGLTATLDQALKIRFQRPVDLLVSLGYAPYVALGDAWALASWPGALKPLGFEAKIDFFFVKQGWGFLGLEAGAQWSHMPGGEPKAVLTSDFVLMGAGALYKYRFTRRLHGLARLGGGLAWSYHSFDYEGFAGPTAWSFDPYANAGLALQAFLPIKLYGEIAVDFSDIFLIGHNLLGVTPKLCVGYQLY
jgi:hypothetical protein